MEGVRPFALRQRFDLSFLDTLAEKIVTFGPANQKWVGTAVLVCGGWKKLASGDARSPLLSLFFIAEALVWGTVGRQGGPVFPTGVDVFHIEAGSYFHYFGSYFFANSR